MTPAEPLAHPTLDSIASAYAAVVIERQMAFEQLVPDEQWSADLAAGVLMIGPRTFSVALLGNEVDETASWQWAWASPGFSEEHQTVRPIAMLRQVGERFDVPELTVESVPLSRLSDGGMGPAHTMAVAGTGLIGARAYYPASYNGGTAYLLITDERLPLPTPSVTELPRVLQAAVSLFPYDHRLTVETYLGVHGLDAVADGGLLRAGLPDGDVDFEFDGFGRLVDLRVR